MEGFKDLLTAYYQWKKRPELTGFCSILNLRHEHEVLTGEVEVAVAGRMYSAQAFPQSTGS